MAMFKTYRLLIAVASTACACALISLSIQANDASASRTSGQAKAVASSPSLSQARALPRGSPDASSVARRSEMETALSPEDENARLLRTLVAAGQAYDDSVDGFSRELASQTLERLQRDSIKTTVDVIRCTRAGCAITLGFDDELDLAAQNRVDEILIGISQESPLLRWKGRRLVGPMFRSGTRQFRSVILIRSESPIVFW